MIRRHEFNSEWWGGEVGIVDDPEFFALPSREQREALDRYEWVEYRCDDEVPPQSIARAGFFAADLQLHFRLDLRKIQASSSAASLTARPAREGGIDFEGSAMRPFEFERFRYLPGVTPERLNDRYARWASALMSKSPEWSLAIFHRDVCQGWFLASREESRLDLTLAMMSSASSISGLLLYECSLLEFARRGARLALASFSARNLPVLNIYTRLGAVFTRTASMWLRVRPQAQ